MRTLTSGERRQLNKLAHHLKPVVYIGKGGLTENVVKALDDALEAHELVKVKFNESKDQKQEFTEELAQRTESVCTAITGNIATLYREQADDEKRRITLAEG